MKLKSLHQEQEAGVLMAPLIDCVFMLLIFFLVTSLLNKPHKELGFIVPHSGVADRPTEKLEPLVIVITPSPNEEAKIRSKKDSTPRREPYIFIGDELLTKELLERRLRQVAQDTPNRTIRIDAEGHLAWRHIVPILDLCRFHNLTKVDVRTP